MRIVAQIVALVIATIGASHYLGSSFADCGWQCKAVRHLWFAPLFSAVSVIAPLAAILLTVRGEEVWYRKLAMSQGVMALIAFILVAANRWLCVTCISIQIIWLALALETIKYRLVAVFAYPLIAVGILNTWGQASESALITSTGPITHKSRSFEPPVKGRTIVIFTDPLCSACRSIEAKLDTVHTSMPVIYRWKLLPQHGDFALRIATAIESAWSQDFAKGNAFFKSVYAGPLPAKDEEIITRAVQSGFDKATATEWLTNPDPVSLQTVRQDGESAANLRIDAVPTLCQVNIQVTEGLPRLSRFEAASLKAMLAEPENASMRSFEVFLLQFRQPNQETGK